MPDLITATAIATLAFIKFIESGAGKLAENLPKGRSPKWNNCGGSFGTNFGETLKQKLL